MTRKTSKTTGKRRKDTRFKVGNKIGHRFKKGDPGGPGRPPAIESPRAQLKKYAEEIAPEKLRKALARTLPGLDTKSLTWAQLVALSHLRKAAAGDMGAIAQMYRQIDDSGSDKQETQVIAELRHSRAVQEFRHKLDSMAARLNASKKRDCSR